MCYKAGILTTCRNASVSDRGFRSSFTDSMLSQIANMSDQSQLLSQDDILTDCNSWRTTLFTKLVESDMERRESLTDNIGCSSAISIITKLLRRPTIITFVKKSMNNLPAFAKACRKTWKIRKKLIFPTWYPVRSRNVIMSPMLRIQKLRCNPLWGWAQLESTTCYSHIKIIRRLPLWWKIEVLSFSCESLPIQETDANVDSSSPLYTYWSFLIADQNE